MTIHRLLKIFVSVVLAASVGFLALLGYSAWMFEPERNVCGNVSPGGLVTVWQDRPLGPWAKAVAAPGYMMEAPDLNARYRYFDAETGAEAKITEQGRVVSSVRESMRQSCTHMDKPPRDICRYFDGEDWAGMLMLRRDHVLESQRDYVAGSIQKTQGDGAVVEVYVTTYDTHELDAAECDMARALWFLSGRD